MSIKFIKNFINTFLILLNIFCLNVWSSESLNCDEVIERENILYKKFTDIPYTGLVKSKCEKICSGRYLRGKPEGNCQTFWEKGGLHKDYNFINGLRNGTQKMYYSNGNLRYKYRMENEKIHGDFENWDEKGSLSIQLLFDNGKCIVASKGECF
tara:strand:- start:460 stop:921 length:462 start_codon:yes stop_codon:yes gene_type:complete